MALYGKQFNFGKEVANEQSIRKWLMSNPLVGRHYYCFELMQMKKPWMRTMDLDPDPVPVLVRK